MKTIFVSALVAASASLAAADTSVSVYGGVQTLPHSVASGVHPETNDTYQETFAWEGKSLSMPAYYGMRVVSWNRNIGYGLEFTHAKAYANEAEAADAGFNRLEFTDGHNIITANTWKRWDSNSTYIPYVGAGVGIAMPHVDAKTDSTSTYGFQVTGPAIQLTAGIEKEISTTLSTFAEYQFSYSWNKVEFENNGTMDVDLKTNALNIGLRLNF